MSVLLSKELFIISIKSNKKQIKSLQEIICFYESNLFLYWKNGHPSPLVS